MTFMAMKMQDFTCNEEGILMCLLTKHGNIHTLFAFNLVLLMHKYELLDILGGLVGKTWKYAKNTKEFHSVTKNLCKIILSDYIWNKQFIDLKGSQSILPTHSLWDTCIMITPTFFVDVGLVLITARVLLQTSCINQHRVQIWTF